MGQAKEQTGRADWHRSRRLATAMLGAAALLFLVARLQPTDTLGVRLLLAFSEAALVGGLADWFAVTVLFRHPLGLRLPHTAIIPSNKARIGESLGRFVQQNFLIPDVILPRLASLQPLLRLAAWLQAPAQARQLATALAPLLDGLIRDLDTPRLRAWLSDFLRERLEAADPASLSADLLEAVRQKERHLVLLDQGVRMLMPWLSGNRTLLEEKIGAQTRWLPRRVDRWLAGKTLHLLLDFLEEVHADPHHPVRADLDAALARFIEDLRTSEEHRRQARDILERMLDELGRHDYLDRAIEALKAALIGDLDARQAPMVRILEQTVIRLGQALEEDARRQGPLQVQLLDVVDRLIRQHGHHVAALIAEKVKSWDSKVVADLLEEQVGRDLQFIRINGTLAGGLIGLVLFATGELAAYWAGIPG